MCRERSASASVCASGTPAPSRTPSEQVVHRPGDRAMPVGQLDQPRLVQVARPPSSGFSPESTTSGQPHREPRLADTAQAR